MTALSDARGCLTPAGMAAVRQSAPGRAPSDLARHLAECPRCQARLLAADLEGTRAAGGRPPAPAGLGAPGRLWRPVVFIVAALVLALGAVALIAALSR
jgi:hypothetical protein